MTPGSKDIANPQGEPVCSASREVLADLPAQPFRLAMRATLKKVQHKLSVNCGVVELELFVQSYTRRINEMCVGCGAPCLCMIL
jgi:hypothetical protein